MGAGEAWPVSAFSHLLGLVQDDFVQCVPVRSVFVSIITEQVVSLFTSAEGVRKDASPLQPRRPGALLLFSLSSVGQN